jgi:hypothetical protein
MISSKHCMFACFAHRDACPCAFCVLLLSLLSLQLRFDIFGHRHNMVDTTTFAAIMTKNGHDQQQTLHVCLVCSQGCLSVCLLRLIVEFVVFVVVIFVFLAVDTTWSTRQHLLRS